MNFANVILTEAAAGGSSSFSIIMIVAMFAIFYFLIIRPESKKKKDAEAMRSSLSNGDEITTIGGIVGKIVQITEDTITIETSEDRVRIQLKKWAVSTTAKMEAAEAARAAGKKSFFSPKSTATAKTEVKPENIEVEKKEEPAQETKTE